MTTTMMRIVTLNPLLLRTVSFLCVLVHHRRLGLGLVIPSDRAWCSGVLAERLCVKEPPKYPCWDDLDYCKWKDKEREILNDIKLVQLTEEDEKIVVERLLAHHPHSEDKIGSGINSIMLNDSIRGPPSKLIIHIFFLVLTMKLSEKFVVDKFSSL
ncbi:protein DCL [Pyrus ussuriensis x Pyrus communis]|uniref:Protein DCL n=1 Tax=Pyrus ussuriensis x Pyrus communis TaxID=2448454 RepID=A0A5N5H273_9ROSA|nr:protein DCL [Pyrus ussuriensis x Pyrus communis]